MNLRPIDPALEESRTVMLSFVWPDQLDRMRSGFHGRGVTLAGAYR